MLKIKSKKGQIRMTETIAVIFIFFILLVFAIIFYGRYQKVAFQEKQELDFANKAIEITTKVLFLPELTCSKGEAEKEDYCFDMLKLRYLKGLSEANLDYYFDLFSYSQIFVYEIYPGGLWAENLEENQKVLPTEKLIIYENVPCPEGCNFNQEEGKCIADLALEIPVSCKVPFKSTFFTVSLRDETESEFLGRSIYKTGFLEVRIFR